MRNPHKHLKELLTSAAVLLVVHGLATVKLNRKHRKYLECWESPKTVRV